MRIKYDALEVLSTSGIVLDKHCSIIINDFLLPSNTKNPLVVSEYGWRLPNQSNFQNGIFFHSLNTYFLSPYCEQDFLRIIKDTKIAWKVTLSGRNVQLKQAQRDVVPRDHNTTRWAGVYADPTKSCIIQDQVRLQVTVNPTQRWLRQGGSFFFFYYKQSQEASDQASLGSTTVKGPGHP